MDGCRFGLHDALDQVLVAFVEALHLTDSAAEDVEAGNYFYIWGFTGFSSP